MNQYQSDKIKILSFLLIILVLYIHSGFHANEIEGMYLNNFIQEFISGKLGRLAVPLFFIISGYLFFLNTENGILSIKRKIQSRVKTLLLPYIYGSIYFVVFLFTLQLLPGLSSFINSDMQAIFNKPLLELIKNVFWMSDNANSPMAFHLWFIRDLIVIIAFTPLLFYFLKTLKWMAIPLLFVLTFVSIVPALLLSSLFWFASGGVFVLTKTSIDYKKSVWGIIIIALYLILSLLELIFGIHLPDSLQKLFIIIGIVGIWYSYNYFVSNNFSLREHKWLTLFTGFTFFIYLFVSRTNYKHYTKTDSNYAGEKFNGIFNFLFVVTLCIYSIYGTLWIVDEKVNSKNIH
jgi:hypothetical protein